MIPTYGFGGVPLHIEGKSFEELSRLKDCFPLNGNQKKAEINGLE